MAVWAVIVPGVLLSRKLNYLNLACETHRLLCAGNVELHVELCSAIRMFVDR